MTDVLSVCISCRAGQELPPDAERPGETLFKAIRDLGAPEGVSLMPVKCLSACKNGSAVALSAAGKWSYVYGQLTPSDAPDILAGAKAYRETTDGLIPWRERPIQFRKQSLARVPPLPSSLETSE